MKKGRLRDILKDRLSPEELHKIYNSYDIIGDIAIIRLDKDLSNRAEMIAEAIMETHKRVKAVLQQTSPVSDTHRLRALKLILGEKRTETEYREYGCRFIVDIAKVYFSPRLSHERMRIAKFVKAGETIINMFAGVGTYSIIIAKHSEPEKVHSIDINPEAVRYMIQNIKLNKVQDIVEPILGDAERIIEESLKGIADRVLMPLPEKALRYVEPAISALKSSGGFIHYYSFERGKEKKKLIEESKNALSQKLHRLGVDFEIPFGRVVRETGPNWHQIALDIRVI